MNRKKKISILVSITIVICFAIIYLFNYAFASAYNSDSCQVISMEVAGRINENGTISKDQIEELIKRKIDSSVINGVITEQGIPKDWNGNDFIVNIDDKKVEVRTYPCIFWQPTKSFYITKIKH